ncbi:hypothetical protein Acr_29g0004720 [Actinidia rufa]|uniref:Retrotransposon gag domain-containing protein n=1 Tax=Actinidia rufa TaxID=165716 RepID=A0A7J0HDU9_9ERIC|nr:hypothetical protein Acr_29g0004720 [Actinidia rufa]
MAYVRDSDALKQMQSRSGAIPECGTVCTVNKKASLDSERAIMIGKNSVENRKISLIKKAITSSAHGLDISHKVKVHEPKSFGGARSAKELENFLRDMEQYFKVARISNDEKVLITSMYLSRDAKLWQRTRTSDETRPVIETWSILKKELNNHFLPCNSSWVARESLRGLRHIDSNWAQLELHCVGVKDLSSTIATADGFLYYKLGNPSTSEFMENKPIGKMGKSMVRKFIPKANDS